MGTNIFYAFFIYIYIYIYIYINMTVVSGQWNKKKNVWGYSQIKDKS